MAEILKMAPDFSTITVPSLHDLLDGAWLVRQQLPSTCVIVMNLYGPTFHRCPKHPNGLLIVEVKNGNCS